MTIKSQMIDIEISLSHIDSLVISAFAHDRKKAARKLESLGRVKVVELPAGTLLVSPKEES